MGVLRLSQAGVLSAGRRANFLAGLFVRFGVAGYFGGGWNGSTNFATVDKFAFPADTRTTLGTGLSSGRRRISAMANSGVAGYFGGGSTGSIV
jgi:hypothetical protein